MKAKTLSEIKTSIKTFRGRRMACRTYQTEDEVIQDIEKRFGEITVPQREIDQILDREKKQAIRANAAKRALLKTFQQRKKARMIQDLVEGRHRSTADTRPGPHQGRKRTPVSDEQESCSEDAERGVVINEIELEY